MELAPLLTLKDIHDDITQICKNIVKEHIQYVPKHFRDALISVILQSLNKYEEETKNFMKKLTKSSTNVLYSHDVNMIERSMLDVKWYLIYRYRKSATEYYLNVMENL